MTERNEENSRSFTINSLKKLEQEAWVLEHHIFAGLIPVMSGSIYDSKKTKTQIPVRLRRDFWLVKSTSSVSDLQDSPRSIFFFTSN